MCVHGCICICVCACAHVCVHQSICMFYLHVCLISVLSISMLQFKPLFSKQSIFNHSQPFSPQHLHTHTHTHTHTPTHTHTRMDTHTHMHGHTHINTHTHTHTHSLHLRLSDSQCYPYLLWCVLFSADRIVPVLSL